MLERPVTDVRINEDQALEAAREFAAALAETVEYQAFEEAQLALQQAELFLPTVNATIRDLLGFDLGSLARIANP